jgi:hypothetical protein
MSNSEFLTMKEVGELFGKTSHAVGKKLKELGLRTADGKPSWQAFERGLCERRFTDDGQNYLWAWHGEMTFRLLRESGFGGSEARGQNRIPDQSRPAHAISKKD